MPKPIAVQLYSLREYVKSRENFVNVVRRVADIGYKAVEPAGFHGLTAAEFKKLADDLGLKIYSTHSPWAGNPDNLQQVVDDLGALGLDVCVCGYGANEFKDLDAIKQTADRTNAILEKLKPAGITLFQHNHDFEFQRINGELKYDIYAKLVPEVKFELDAFWSANFGAEDEVANVKKYAGRMILVHIKDGTFGLKEAGQKYGADGFLDTKIELLPLGKGKLNIPGIVAALPEQVSSIVVELDYCEIDMWEAIEESYKYMTSNGFAVGNK